MTRDDIAKARAIIDAATPGPWEAVVEHGDLGDRAYVWTPPPGAPDDAGDMLVDGFWHTPAGNAAFVAAAREGWPAALAEVERLRATVERVREAVGFIDGLVREAREVIKAVEDAGRSPTVHEICVLAMADTCERLAGLLRQALEAP